MGTPPAVITSREQAGQTGCDHPISNGGPGRSKRSHTDWVRGEHVGTGARSSGEEDIVMRIEDGEPATWDELEDRVARILTEAGLRAERGRALGTARGSVNVDVYAEDASVNPPVVTLFECKHWKRPIPQNVIHAFRSVVADSGANSGIIVSLSGFQPGAEGAVQFSNLKLVDWDGFQALFAERWFHGYMVKRALESLDPLVEYTEPINSRITKKAGLLPEAAREVLKHLREQHVVPAMTLSMVFFSGLPNVISGTDLPPLPIRPEVATLKDTRYFPDAILDATSLRGLLNAVIAYADTAVAQFDAVFGSRA